MGAYDDPGAFGYFLAGGPDGASASEARRKIALAMMMKKSTAPKNLGEGIASVGSHLADAIIAKSSLDSVAQQAAQADAQIRAIERGTTPGVISGIAVPGPRAEAETGETTAAPAQQVAAVTPVAAPVSDGADPWTARSAGIAGIESGGAKDPYSLVGARTRTGDRAIGKYQVMGANVPSWTQAALSQSMTPEQFRASPDAQEAVFKHRFGQYVDKYGEEGAARAWYGGEKGMKNLGASDVHGRLTVGSYGQDYLKRLGAAGGPREAIAAAMATQPAAQAAAPMPPPELADAAQDARLSEVTGMTRAPPPGAFAPTASRTGDIQTDLPPVTGAIQGPLGQAVGDSVQQRQDTFQPPQPVAPQPGPQLAQGPGPFPPVASDVKPILPGGGFPQVAPQIQAAPPDPRNAIRAAPQDDEYVPRDRPMPLPPRKPGPGPEELKYTPLLYSDVDPRVKEAAKLRIERERSVRGADYEERLKTNEVEKADWLKEQEQNRLYRQKLPGERATTRKTTLEADEKQIQLGGLPERLTQERRELEAKVGKAQADAQVAQQNAAFQAKVGREREPFLKEFATEKGQVEKFAGLLRNANAADEALKTGDVVWGSGAEAKLALARIGSSLGNKRAAEIAANSEKYKQASDSTLGYGIFLVNGKDPRVTDADIQQAKGLTGTLDMQRESQQRIINAMREDMRGKVANYEDVREQYLRGDPQHRFFKVDTPPTAPPAVTKALLDNRDNEGIRRRYDADYGPGAAALEIKRALRREERAKKTAQEDD